LVVFRRTSLLGTGHFQHGGNASSGDLNRVHHVEKEQEQDKEQEHDSESDEE
jgi:hypothetical protein